MIEAVRLGQAMACAVGFMACSFPRPTELTETKDGAVTDASSPIDVALLPIDAQTCFGTGIVQVCLTEAPTSPLTISSSNNITTDDTSLCAATVSGATSYCVLAATTITIDATLRGLGTRPLVLIASDAILVRGPSGVVDVGSHRNPDSLIGAGGNSSQCPNQPTLPTTANGSSGGGAGGSFASEGGSGGNGGNGNVGVVGGTGGAPTPSASASAPALRGGCFGQAGAGFAPGGRGDGGDAVFLIAGSRIDITGTILATGEGGLQAGSSESGGGGGGSGGMIGFDAPTVTGTGLILASGGGGGGGAGVDVSGTIGAEPTTIDPAAGGPGGLGGEGGEGSPVGLGASAASGFPGRSAANQNSRGGGGGGGGGGGVIIAPSNATLGGNTSPFVSH